MKNLIKKVLFVTVVLSALISCKKDDNAIPENQGAVKVKLTDDPFPFDFVTAANVGIAKIELHNTNGTYTTVFEGNTSFNMVGLTNGDTETVVTENVDAGTYDQVRVTLNTASVHLSNGTSYDLNADAQGSYTVAISPALVVEEGDTSEFLLDLDINDSFDFLGNWFGEWISSVSSIVGCHFDADFRACDLDQTGEISGTVTASGTAVANALVSIDVNGETISTQTENDGSFTFIGVNDGTYTVHVDSEASGSGSVSNVQVSGTGTATCNVSIN